MNGQDDRISLRLYVTGDSPRSREAFENLKAACQEHLGEPPDLEVVDILKDPISALSDGVFVTPLLVRLSPTPVARVFGDLRDRAALLALLLGPGG